ncbi:MAG TPA: glycosyltransferase family 2 protein [Burkholderiales bacterium]|nr:glycosyltransferase family 2 protein [Burkholderiales bacterium]
MLITAVIPTRNRPDDLERVVLSVCGQSRPADELIIVDQSPGDESRVRVEKAIAAAAAPARVDYMHDTRITGLVDAKRAAVALARGDVVCFLEDDVVLERDYLEMIERGFEREPTMAGTCGIVTNLPPLPPLYFRLFHFFHRGIFHDARVGVTGVAKGSGLPLIPSDYLSGGLSAYRREVFDAVTFDVANQFFALEDIDFSTRVARVLGPRLFINPNARLEHRMSPVNRAVLGPREERKVREFIVFYKKRRNVGARPAHLALLGVGLFLEAAYQAVRGRSFGPIPGFFRGLWRGARWKLADE